MIRLLHTADLHLDAPFPSLGEKETERQGDFLRTFDRLVALALHHEVHLFLVAGDLFDSPHPSPAAVAQGQAGMQRLVAGGIVPVILPGTHDPVVAPDAVFRRTSFPGVLVLTEPQVLEPVQLEVAGQQVFLYGFAYRSAQSEDALTGFQRRTGEGIHIGLLHGSRVGSPEWDYRKKDLPFDVPLLQSWGLDYVALGHYHAFERIATGHQVLACYPGSPEGKRFGENGPRYCALVSIAPGSVMVEPCPVNGRVLEEGELDLSGFGGDAAVMEAISAMGQPDLLLRLTLTGIVEVPLALQVLRSQCREAFFHLELVDRTRLFDSDLARRVEQEETVRGVFVRRVKHLMAEAGPDQRRVLEEAFREVMVRFGRTGDGEQ